MKKTIIAILAVSVLALSLNGCGLLSDYTEKAEAAREAATAETTEETVEETTTETTEETTTEETTVAETENLQEIEDSRADGSWTVDLVSHLNATDKILITVSTVQDDIKVTSISAKKDNMLYVAFGFGGEANLKMISDGTTVYTIDDQTRTFSKQTEEEGSSSMDMDMDMDTLGMENAPTVMLGHGIESVEGTDYIYEEFEDTLKNDDGTFAKVKYYYDSNRDLVACAQTQNGVTTLVWTTIEFEDVPDELFVVPTGYKEISADDMAMISLQKIMSAMPTTE